MKALCKPFICSHVACQIVAIETSRSKFSWSVLLCFNNATRIPTISTVVKDTGNSPDCVSSPKKTWSILLCSDNPTPVSQRCWQSGGGGADCKGDSPPWKYDCWQVQYVSWPHVKPGLNRRITLWVDVNSVKASDAAFGLWDIPNWKLVFYYPFYHAYGYFEWIREFVPIEL